MIFKKRKIVSPRDIEERILALTAEREQVKKRIRTLRSDMRTLVREAVDADDLEQNIKAMDYETRKDLLAVETEHFNDLNHLIAQLRSLRTAGERRDALSAIENAGSCIDTDALIMAEDEIAVRRDMLQEENQRLSETFARAAAGDPRLPGNAEFDQLVRQERAVRSCTASPSQKVPARQMA